MTEGDRRQNSACFEICGIRIPSGASRQLPLGPRGALDEFVEIWPEPAFQTDWNAGSGSFPYLDASTVSEGFTIQQDKLFREQVRKAA